MDSIETRTLWSLPSQPLPAQTNLVGAIFAVIWLFLILILAVFFILLLFKANPTWPEFRDITIGAVLLFVWYLAIVVDRFIHYDGYKVGKKDGHKVPYGYILYIPISEIFYAGSTIYTLWGTFKVVWKELESRFSGLTKNQKLFWWLAGNFALLILCMVSLFYVILYIALAIVWMEFVTLNIIDDVATKRNGFEIAMNAFFFGFSFITAGASSVALWSANRVSKIRKTRVLLWVATIILLGRSIAQFAIALRVNQPDILRKDTLLASDISHGILSVLFLGAMYFFARSVTAGFDKDGDDAHPIESDIRRHILNKLQQDTSNGRLESREFETLLQDVSLNLENILDHGPLSSKNTANRAQKRVVAQRYIEELRRAYGDLNPKEGRDFRHQNRTPTPGFIARRAVGGRRTVSSEGMRTPSARSSPAVRRDHEVENRFTPRVPATLDEE